MRRKVAYCANRSLSIPRKRRKTHRELPVLDQQLGIGRLRTREYISKGDIDALALQIHHVVARKNANVGLRVYTRKSGQIRDEPGRCQRSRRSYSQHVCRSGEPIGGGVYECECLVSRSIELFASLSKRQSAICSVKQRLSELLFQRVNGPADGRLSDKLLLRSAGEAKVARGRSKGAKEI
jgi:hypothetical protein